MAVLSNAAGLGMIFRRRPIEPLATAGLTSRYAVDKTFALKPIVIIRP
jgi:hypothetical protein